MIENFDYEQKTVNQLFERYQRYKPIASGLYGQDVVIEPPIAPSSESADAPNN